jgi:hypothetical protein
MQTRTHARMHVQRDMQTRKHAGMHVQSDTYNVTYAYTLNV